MNAAIQGLERDDEAIWLKCHFECPEQVFSNWYQKIRNALSGRGAREVARQQGTSLNALIRDYIEGLAGQVGGDEILSEFQAMWGEPGNSGGKPFKREELSEERMNRYAPR